MKFTYQIRLLFVVPLTIMSSLILIVAFWPWFTSVYDQVDNINSFLTYKEAAELPIFYSLICNSNLKTLSENNTQLLFSEINMQYYIMQDTSLACVMTKQTGIGDIPTAQQQNISNLYFQFFYKNLTSELITGITGDMNRIIQITLSTAAIGIVIIWSIINHYSRRLAYLIVEPINELISSLRNLTEENMDEYFSEMLQGQKSHHTPTEMKLLLRSVYDFIGIVKIANEAFIQGNDSQAIIGYAVANQFYLSNGNVLGAGVIQNNMGVIHIRNKRFSEAIICFRESIICIENEWESYKQKYEKYGIWEEELIIDQEYQNLSQIVFNRCFNLCEALTEFLMTEILELQEFIFTIRKQRRSQTSIESKLYAQMHLSNEVQSTRRERATSILKSLDYNPLDNIGNQQMLQQNIKDLIKLNDVMYALRVRFLGTHDYENAIMITDINLIGESELKTLIVNLWKDVIKAYNYCKNIMELQLSQKTQRHLYITLKIILGNLNVGSIDKCDDLFDEAKRLLNQSNKDEICPVSILKQKYHLFRGMVLYKKQFYSDAAKELHNSLMIDNKINSRDRMQALILLKAIFSSQNLDISIIEQNLLLYQPIVRDFYIVLEASKRMKQNLAIIRGLRVAQTIIKGMQQQDDRLSFGLITDKYQELVPLVYKQKNSAFIDKILNMVPRPSKKLNLDLQGIADRYAPHQNQIRVGNNFYLKKNGVPQMRYKRILIFICFDCPIQQIDGVEVVLIQLGGQKNEQSFSENESDQILQYFDQQKTENVGSNFYLEQTI